MDIKTNNHSPDTAFITTSGIDGEISDNFLLDRYLDDTLSLPFSFNNIKIKSNELCVSDNINAALFKVHFNFLYLNAQTKIASNDFPKIYRGYVSSTEVTGPQGVGWYTHTNSLCTNSNAVSSQYQASTSGTILSGIVDGAFAESLGTRTRYVGFVANSATLMAYQSKYDDTDIAFRLNKKTIEDATSLSFTQIKQLAINSQNRLFVIDDTFIHKFDVDAVLTDNPAISAIGRFLIKTIGGKSSTLYDKDKFGNPVAIAIGGNDDVYILDHGDNGYKTYDKDLNWRNTNSRRNDFADLSGGNVTDIAVDMTNEFVYILVDNGVILEYSDQGLLVEKHIMTDSLAPNEKYKRLTFSKINEDILYVMTNQSLYKKFISKLPKSIGAFRLNKQSNSINNELLKFVDVLQSTETTYDYVMLGADSTHYTSADKVVGKVFKFNEKINYQSVVYDRYKINAYALSAVNINTDEYVTSWVINKAMYKILYNHLLFRDNLHSRYMGEYDDQGRVQYAGINYVKDSDANLYLYNLSLDNFIGLNEPVLAETINRPLKQLYDLQVDLLDMVSETVLNKYPYNNQVVGL